MISRPIFRITSKVLILITFSVGLWLLAGPASSRQQDKLMPTLLPVQVKQLDPVSGVVPVELRCSDAQLSSPKAIERLTCTIKNNTDRFITAGTVAVAIDLERNGTELELQSYDTFDTFVHADFNEDHKNNRIRPGGEFRIDELPSSYSDGIIKSIAVGIDYIEFADNQRAGLNRKGSQIIGDMREGASKYKAWLKIKYKESGRSVDAVSALLDRSPSARELFLQNSNQESGADMFRKYLLRDYKEKGMEPLKRHLDQ